MIFVPKVAFFLSSLINVGSGSCDGRCAVVLGSLAYLQFPGFFGQEAT